MIRFPNAFAASLVLVSSLTACGFHLRNSLALPPDTPAVKVQSAVQYSELAKLLRRGLKAAGATLADVAQVLIYMTDVKDMPVIDSIYREFFEAPYPNRSSMGVNALVVPGMKIEIVAYVLAPPKA